MLSATQDDLQDLGTVLNELSAELWTLSVRRDEDREEKIKVRLRVAALWALDMTDPGPDAVVIMPRIGEERKPRCLH